MVLRPSKAPYAPRCHWCKGALDPQRYPRYLTAPADSEWPDLPLGVGVAVCGHACPNRPAGAPVGTDFIPPAA